jgi:predicted transcriptional regulator
MNQTKLFTMRMTEEMTRRLQELADANEVSLAVMVRLLVRDAHERKWRILPVGERTNTGKAWGTD